MVKKYDVTVSTDLARRICEQFDVDMDQCGKITVELLPSEPIKVSFQLFGGEAFEGIDWEGSLVTAQTTKRTKVE